MKSWKTTVAAVIAGMAQLLPTMGIGVNPDVAQAISAVGLFVLGLLAKDFNVTGGKVQQ
jgi:hypothetical protein